MLDFERQITRKQGASQKIDTRQSFLTIFLFKNKIYRDSKAAWGELSNFNWNKYNHYNSISGQHIVYVLILELSAASRSPNSFSLNKSSVSLVPSASLWDIHCYAALTAEKRQHFFVTNVCIKQGVCLLIIVPKYDKLRAMTFPYMYVSNRTNKC